jgi:predicted transcriptional regulator
MSALTVRLPDSLHRHLKNAAETDGVSVNQFISLAVAEKLSALQTYDIISRRAESSSRDAFLAAMAAVPAGEVVEGDEIPKDYQPKE